MTDGRQATGLNNGDVKSHCHIKYIFVHVSVYVYMCRQVYVHEHDCFMYVHMCTYCVCMYVMTMYRAVRIPLVLNCAI